MKISRMVALWLALALIAGAGWQAAAQTTVAAPENWYMVGWQIRSLPTINALNFTADQLAQVIPVLKEINKQLEEAAKTPPVTARQATQLAQVRDGLLQGNLGQQDIDNAKDALKALDEQKEKVFEALPAVQQLKKLLTDEQKTTLEGAVILGWLRHHGPPPAPPTVPPAFDVATWRAEQMVDKVRQAPDQEYQEKRTLWATDLIERVLKREDPNFAGKVAAMLALFDGARKLTNKEFEAQRQDLIKQIRPYTGGDEPAPPPPPPPPPFMGTGGKPNLEVLTDARVIELLELKLAYLQAAAGGG